MKRKKVSHKLLFEHVYGACVDFVWNCSDKELKMYMNERYNYDDDDSESYGGAVIKVKSNGKDQLELGQRVYIIWISKKDDDYLDHEVMHLAGTILGDCGVRYSPENDEHYVYYKIFWMNIFKKLLNKKKHRRKKHRKVKV